MKKYEAPQLEEVVIEIEDIIAASGDTIFGGGQPGDNNHPFPW